MRKRVILRAVLVLGLLTSLFLGVQNVKAQYISTDVEVTYGSLETLVNQRVELTATNSGGTPPYTYRWYINDQPVQGATSSKLEFIESTPGLYYISLGITDSSGNYTLATFMGTFFIKVLAVPTPSASSSPSPTSQPETAPKILEPIVSFTQWHTSSPVIQPPANRSADIQPIVEIMSPRNQTTFQTSNVTLTVNVASYFWILDSVYYQADWQDGVHQIFGIQPNYEDALNATITAAFTQIPIGNHTVEIYANTHDGMHTFSTVTFLTEGYLPKISVLSTENQTYISKDLTLNFTIDKPTSWIGYSLDGQGNVTVNPTIIINNGVINNITIANLTNGFHSLIVYANDTMGDMSASQPINFSIASSTAMRSESLPTIFTIALASVIIVLACVSFLLFYGRHQKTQLYNERIS
ncbi:MAG: PKD domain-containing protein [Candidatus Bathyarchaeia archaeon]|jgi:hypothetical protein